MIRLPDIPGLQQTNINNPGVSARAVAAPAIALGELATSVGNVSEFFHGEAVRLQKMENLRTESERRQQLAAGYADLQMKLQSDPDPLSRKEKMAGFLQDSKGLMDDPSLPPAVRDSLTRHFDEFASHATISQAQDSMNLGIRRAMQAAKNELQTATDTGNETAAMQVIDRLESEGIVLPEEAEAQRMDVRGKIDDFRKEQDFKADLALIDQDPFAARPLLESPTPPEGEDATAYARKREHLRLALGREQNRIVDGIRDGMASGKITTPDQLDAYAEKLGPAAVETMKSGMMKSVDEARKLEVSKPENQAAIIGEVSSAIDALDPKNIEDRVRIEQALDEIQPGPTKNHLSGEITKKLSGELPSPGPMRRVLKMSNEVYQRGYYGRVASTTPQTTADAIDDGFVQDGAKLQSLGFSQDQISKIQNPELKPSQQLDQFRKLWPSRDATKEIAADSYTRSAAEAIVTRRNQITPPAEQRNRERQESLKTLRRKGETEKGLIEWQQDHPDGDVEKEFFRRLGDQESTTFLDTLGGGDWFAEDNAATLTNPELPAGMGSAGDTILPPK